MMLIHFNDFWGQKLTECISFWAQNFFSFSNHPGYFSFDDLNHPNKSNLMKCVPISLYVKSLHKIHTLIPVPISATLYTVVNNKLQYSVQYTSRATIATLGPILEFQFN